MGDVLLAGQLPPLHELVVHGPLQHDGGGEVVEAARHSRRGELVAEVLRRFDAVDDIPLDSTDALLPEAVPKVQSGLSVPATHDGRIDAVQVVDPLLDLLHVLLPRQRHAARHGTAEHLVPRHGDGIDRLPERHLRREVDEGHHHGEQRAVAVDVVALAGDAELLEDAQDPVEVVHGALDGRADVHVDDDGPVDVLGDLGGQDVVVDLAHGQRRDGLGVHPVVPRRLEDGVVRLLGGVEDAVGVALASEEYAVEVALGATRGDVSPVRVLLHLP
mmetsp:Transcript_18701/g.34632  ORF Transcript_18701/g.34632 Transcript_18701/m.34632 type:complete len:274 (-) Transcript_18701:155-976(-)